MFLTAPSAALDRSPWGDFWFEPVGMRTLSGQRVTDDTAMQLSAVFRAISLVSGHVAVLPMSIKRAGTMKRIKKHWLLDLFKKPNRFQNGLEWRQMQQAHLMLRGNAYNEIISNARGQITELIPLHPDRTHVDMLDNGSWRYRITGADGSERFLARGEVWHLRGLSSNGITGLSVISAARESIGLSLSAQNYGARFFANDARPSGGWIEFPGKFADKEARKLFRESVQEAQAGANRGKIMALDNGMKFHEVGLNNADAQFLETRKFQISDVARWFGVPPHKLGDLDRATFSNIEQQALEYITDTLLFWVEVWEAAIEDGLLFDSEDIEIDFSFSKLLRGDSGSRSKFYTSGINAGWLTRNEAREDDGREPIDGLDEPLRPLNMVEESDVEDDAEEAESDEEPAPVPKKQPENEESDDKAAALSGKSRLLVLASATAERIARKEAAALTAMVQQSNFAAVSGFFDKHARFVSGALGVSLQSASDYCADRLTDSIRVGHEESDITNSAYSRLVELAMKGTP